MPKCRATPDEFNQFLIGVVDGIVESITGVRFDSATRLDCFDLGIEDCLVPLVKWNRFTPSDLAKVINRVKSSFSLNIYGVLVVAFTVSMWWM